MKKTAKLFFVEKNEAQTSGFVVAKKVFEKFFFGKKIPLADLCRYDLQNRVQQLFLNKWLSRYLSFSDFKVPKNCSSQ